MEGKMSLQGSNEFSSPWTNILQELYAYPQSHLSCIVHGFKRFFKPGYFVIFYHLLNLNFPYQFNQISSNKSKDLPSAVCADTPHPVIPKGEIAFDVFEKNFYLPTISVDSDNLFRISF